jgi:oligopeptidase B
VFAAGGSAGGLLMGAVINLRPELYRGIIAWVPFVDVVTTMLDEDIPLTTGEFDEWGNPKEKAFYDYMLSYSPYDNVEGPGLPGHAGHHRPARQPGAVLGARQVGGAPARG